MENQTEGAAKIGRQLTELLTFKKSIQVDCSLFWQLIRNIIELKLNISEYRLSYFGLKWSLIYLLSVTIAVKCRWEIIPCMYIDEKFRIKFQFG